MQVLLQVSCKDVMLLLAIHHHSDRIFLADGKYIKFGFRSGLCESCHIAVLGYGQLWIVLQISHSHLQTVLLAQSVADASCHRRTCHYGCDNWAMIALMMYATVMSALRKDVDAYQCHEGYECSFLDLSDCYHINISLIFYL